MKTQISREGFDAGKRYSGVYQQQGRMIVDRDWNELVDILKDRLNEAMIDVVGSGSPKARAARIEKANAASPLRIHPGVLYAGGVGARLTRIQNDDFAKQSDFPLPPPLPANGTAYTVYADIWERPVLALEDESLRDPGLHGADTCTRSQTLAQIKWAPANRDPQDPAQNPARGNATLRVRFPEETGEESTDPCDPAIDEVEPAGGDFLYRLEVHDVTWAAGAAPNAPDRAVVKWSRENGAEHHRFAEATAAFKTGPWIYEIYRGRDEKHLGYHLAAPAGWSPSRGSLVTPFPAVAPLPDTKADPLFVRRWDGYCVLRRTGGGWTLSSEAADDPAKTAPGAEVKVASNQLTLGFPDLEVTLSLGNKTLLAGDYWLAPVRRALFEPGFVVLDDAEPLGVLHRYLTLGQVEAAGTLKPRTAAEERRLGFPRLTELTAADVGYTGNCPNGLFDATHDTVKKALDRLCGLSAEHVAFPKPCNTSVYQGATVNTVADALKLLCNVQAQQVGYTNPAAPSVQEVKAALDELFQRPVGGGCRVTVGTGGQFETLDAAITALLGEERTDIALCLLPGEHVLASPLGVLIPPDEPPVRLSIEGAGEATRLAAQSLSFTNLASFTLEGVNVTFAKSAFLELKNAGSITLAGNVLEGDPQATALVEINGAESVLLRDSTIDVAAKALSPLFTALDDLLVPDRSGLFLLKPDLFRTQALKLAVQLSREPINNRETLANKISSAFDQHREHRNDAEPAFRRLTATLTSSFAPRDLAFQLEQLRLLAVETSPGLALVLGDGRAQVYLEDNRITGLVSLYGKPGTLIAGNNEASNLRAVANRLRFSPTLARFEARNNTIVGFRISDAMVKKIKTILQTESPVEVGEVFREVVLTDNALLGGESHWAGAHLHLTSNVFTSLKSPVGYVAGSSAIYVGNRGQDPDTVLWSITPQASEVGTLSLTIVA